MSPNDFEEAKISGISDSSTDPPKDKDENSGNKKKKIKDEKRCRVCGDVALGYNFDAVTCESCKAFFRRNARGSKVMNFSYLLFPTTFLKILPPFKFSFQDQILETFCSHYTLL